MARRKSKKKRQSKIKPLDVQPTAGDESQGGGQAEGSGQAQRSGQEPVLEGRSVTLDEFRTILANLAGAVPRSGPGAADQRDAATPTGGTGPLLEQDGPASSKPEGPSTPGDPAGAAELSQRRMRFGLWLGGLSLVVLFYLMLKMFTMNAYAGDEHIYLYQAKLVSEGVAPYSGFPMAHPPLQALLTGLLFKLVGYHFLLGRLLPVLFCLAGGLVLAVMVHREMGAVASVAAAGLYLLAYEPLRASSHYSGVNLTVALLIAGVFAYRSGAIRLTAAFCVAAIFTRLYAIPGVAVLVAYALLADRRQGVRLTVWGAGMGLALLVGVGLWTGFGDLVEHTFLYHVHKTPMAPGALANMRNKVLFHNTGIATLFVLAQFAVFQALDAAYERTDKRSSVWARLREAVRATRTGLVLLSSTIAVVFLAVLLSMNRVWMYYFIPSFPFAAVAGGWLVSRWAQAGVSLARAGGKLGPAGLSRGIVAGGAAVFVIFAASFFVGPRLEHDFGYYKQAMAKPPSRRVHRYAWQPGYLPDWLNAVVRKTLWSDERVIGNWYPRFRYLLWHESRVLDVVDDVVSTIQSETNSSGEIFGDSGTVPLFALLSGRRIAANEVDTNIQRYRSGSVEPQDLVERIDNPNTEMIIFRRRFGVAGVREVQALVRDKYEMLRSVRTGRGRVYSLYRRQMASKPQ